MPEATVLVMGCTGFIGAAVAKRFKDNQCKVIEASSKNCDLFNSESTINFLNQIPSPYSVVFCAGIVRGEDSRVENPNHIMVLNFLNGLHINPPVSFIYLSTTDVYGATPPQPITEASPLDPSNSYAVDKLKAEVELSGPNHEFRKIILRIPGIFGPGDRGKSIVGRFVNALNQGNKINILGDGSLMRDYVFVDDLSAVIYELFKGDQSGIYNVATGEPHSLSELADLICAIKKVEKGVDYVSKAGEGQSDLVFDTSYLRAALPEFRFRSLRQTVDLYIESPVPR